MRATLLTIRCQFCLLQYEVSVITSNRLGFVLDNLRCPHCLRARTPQGDAPGRRCNVCNIPEHLLPSFKSLTRPTLKLVKGMCTADYMRFKRMNKGRSTEHTASNEA